MSESNIKDVGDKKMTIAELMSKSNIRIEPDGSVKEIDPPEISEEVQAAIDALPVRQFGDSY